jgi:D-xylose 1-dehydrogenase (NADP+, D-xylono-1,5-lactone-forming)
MKKVRWGILSTADIGLRALIPAIRGSQRGEVIAISSRDSGRAQMVAKEYGIPRAHGSYEELIADPDVDAIYNPLPNHMHGEWSIKAAQAGKPVLCEKPFARDAAEAQRMVDEFARRNLLLAEGFMYRFHPQQQLVKQLVRQGAVGNLNLLRVSFTFWMSDERHAQDIRTKAEMAGGALMDVGTYCVNLMRFITEEEPKHVSASAVWAASGTDDTVVGTLQFPSGVLGHFDCGFRSAFESSYELRGDAGRIVVHSAFLARPDEVKTIQVWRGENCEAITVPEADQYSLMVDDFNDALLNQRMPTFPPQDAVRQMQVLDRLYASARGELQ